MKKIVLGLFVGFVLLTCTAEAASISFYRREALISPVEVSIEDTIVFEQSPSKMEIPLLFDAHTLSSRSTLSGHICELEEKDYGSLITCELPEGDSGRLSLEFKVNELVRYTGKHYYFEEDLVAPYVTGNMIYNAKLEEGFVLIDEDLDTPFDKFSPGYGEESSDGRRIYILWSKEDVERGNGIRPRISFERTEEPDTGVSEVYVIILGISIVLLLIAVGTKFGEEEGTLPDALKEDERMVIKIIRDSGGQIKQKRIVDSVDFSKAKVSRLIHDLKERGLLETEKVGRTNRVKLRKFD